MERNETKKLRKYADKVKQDKNKKRNIEDSAARDYILRKPKNSPKFKVKNK